MKEVHRNIAALISVRRGRVGGFRMNASEVDELIALIVRGLIVLNILVPALYFLLGQRDAFRCSVSLDHCRVLTGTARQVLDLPALPLFSLLEWQIPADSSARLGHALAVECAVGGGAGSSARRWVVDAADASAIAAPCALRRLQGGIEQMPGRRWQRRRGLSAA